MIFGFLQLIIQISSFSLFLEKSYVGRQASYIQNPLFSAGLELNAVLTIQFSFGIRISIVWGRLRLVAASVAVQYVFTHPRPSHNINNLSFFALKREFLSFYPLPFSELEY